MDMSPPQYRDNRPRHLHMAPISATRLQNVQII